LADFQIRRGKIDLNGVINACREGRRTSTGGFITGRGLIITRARTPKNTVKNQHGKTRLAAWVKRLSTEILGQEGNSAKNTVSFGFRDCKQISFRSKHAHNGILSKRCRS